MYCYYPISFNNYPIMTFITNETYVIMSLTAEEMSYFEIRFFDTTTGGDGHSYFKSGAAIWCIAIGW